MHFAKCIVDLDQRLERLGKSERLGLVSSRKARRLVSVSSRTKVSMSWSCLGLGGSSLGLISCLVSRQYCLGLVVKTRQKALINKFKL